ncbi:MAG: hypothetical protein WBR15_00575 [Gammaproteobacteria bacterium]
MYKFLANAPVFIACKACGKMQEKKLKWVKKNKSLKCKKCGKNIDLTQKDVKRVINDLAKTISAFETALAKLYKTAHPIKIKKKSASKRLPKRVPAISSPTPTAVVKEKRSFV